MNLIGAAREAVTTEADYARKLEEIDRLLNDPTQAMDAAKVWSLLADVRETCCHATQASKLDASVLASPIGPCQRSHRPASIDESYNLLAPEKR